MIILAVDTSGAYASAAIMRNGTIISDVAFNNGLVHSKSIMPIVEQALAPHSMHINDIDVFAAVAGPGSFTGIRIGICAVKGFAQAFNKPCIALNTLEVLASNVFSDALVCPILDARRSQLYCAAYKNGKEVIPCDARSVQDFLSLIGNEKAVFCGDGVPVYKDLIASTINSASFAPEHLAFTRAAAACSLAQKRQNQVISAKEIDAIYLRKPQAEREYDSKH